MKLISFQYREWVRATLHILSTSNKDIFMLWKSDLMLFIFVEIYSALERLTGLWKTQN